MARKRPLFLHYLFSLLKQVRSLRRHPLSLFVLFLLTCSVTLGAIAPALPSQVINHSPGVKEQPLAVSSPTTTLLQQGLKLYQTEQFLQAIEVLQQASVQGDGSNRALALNYLSLAYQKLGQWPEAKNAVTASLKLLQELPQSEHPTAQLLLAQALNTQGQLQLALGQAEAALASWEQANANYVKAHDQTGTVGSLINQAEALQALGLYQRALAQLTQVNQILQPQPDSLLKATSLRSLGNALRVVGDLQQSRQVLTQSLAIAETFKSVAVADILLSLGNTAQAQQESEVALDFYQKAATVSSSSAIQLQAQLNQLNLLLETQQGKVAQGLLPSIQSLLVDLPVNRSTVYARINLAQSLIRLKQQVKTHQQELEMPSWTETAQLVATAVQQARNLGDLRAQAYALGSLGRVYEQTQQWSIAQNLTEQALFLAQSIQAPDISYRWQWQTGRLLKATGKTQAAIAAYTEAVKTLKALRSDLVAINPEIQFSFRDSVEPIYREFVGLLLQPGKAEPSQENLIQARNAIESLQLAELENFFRQACLDSHPVQIDQVDQTATVIYPIILAERLEVIVSLPQQPLHHYATLQSREEVESVLRALRESLSNQASSRFLPLSQQVYDWLVRPIAAELEQQQIKTIVFVLDGLMRGIPMSALHDGQQYLLQKYGVALAPGLELLDVKPLAREQLRVLTAGLSESRYNFAPLPNVMREVEQIQATVPSRILLNQEFTSSALQTAINSFLGPIVHLATHGEFSSRAEDTFILAWDGRININQLSNLLKQQGTSRPVPIELLVLSACRTAVGDKRAALGLAGVAVRAGARSTLGTLWYVDDAATSSVMAKFYEEFAKSAVTKAEALRRAQLTLFDVPTYQHPYFWSPYILVGNWL